MQPNVITYNTLLNLDIVVYNILIDGASKNGKFDIARKLFNELRVRGLQPNVWTYNVMISGFCEEGLVTEAKEFFLRWKREEMEGRGFSLDTSTVSMLLDHIKARSLDASLLKLIGKLVPKEEVDAPCFRV
ncbi:unnamed protein product [Lactuca virosa]|uniref:Pentatricopeptide repeat-containing protein n=1 Tax=Lactuca virosa TaxID=75947 RepID=A0AAU9LHM3_9ASTR|nr:unnamed protein product [Lactuca virosa]